MIAEDIFLLRVM